MKFIARLAVSFFTIGLALNAFAWGNEGHQTIGAMADKLIVNTPAAAHVHALLGDETLSTASVWADEVKGRRGLTPEMMQFKNDNPNHSVHHYADIPFEEKSYTDTSVGATNVDVVHSIPACILILQGKPDEQHILKNVSPRVALRLLVHYLEDLHQPLHVGAGYLHGLKFVDPDTTHETFKDDQGGNKLLFGGTNKLHFYWDVTVVQDDMAKAHVQTPAEYAAYLLSKPAPNWKDSAPLMQWDRDWANESLALSAKVHDVTVTNEDDSQKDYRTGGPYVRWHIKDLSPQYIAWADQTAENQLTKAGYRVAAVLEAIWPN